MPEAITGQAAEETLHDPAGEEIDPSGVRLPTLRTPNAAAFRSARPRVLRRGWAEAPSYLVPLPLQRIVGPAGELTTLDRCEEVADRNGEHLHEEASGV